MAQDAELQTLREAMRVLALVACTALAPVRALAAEGFADPLLLMSTKALASVLKDPSVRVIDARNPNEFKRGHIRNAVNLPASSLVDPESRIRGQYYHDTRLAQKFGRQGVGSDTHVVVYDAQGGRLAAELLWALSSLGHPLVSVLDGGFLKWKEEKRPIEQSVLKVDRRPFAIDHRARVLATAGWIMDHAQDPDLVILDARLADEYVKDHIPGAINIPWDWSLTAEQTWKAPKQLQAIFEQSGVSSDRNVIVYSDVGGMSSLTYLILKSLGYPRVRVYHRSWAEWSSDLSLPTVRSTRPPDSVIRGIFRANGCVECHQPAERKKGVSFTEAGLKASRFGSGCVALLSKIVDLAAATESPTVEEARVARSNFVDHGCVKCHSAEGNGQPPANLNKVGLQYRDKNLGCVAMMVLLR